MVAINSVLNARVDHHRHVNSVKLIIISIKLHVLQLVQPDSIEMIQIIRAKRACRFVKHARTVVLASHAKQIIFY